MRFGNIVLSTLALSGVSALDTKASFYNHATGTDAFTLTPKQIENKEKLEALLKDVDLKKLKASSKNHVIDEKEVQQLKKSLSRTAKSPKDVLKLSKRTTIDESHRHLATTHYKNNFLVLQVSENCYYSSHFVFGWLVNFCYELEDSSYVIKVNRGQNNAVFISYDGNNKCYGVPSAVYDIFERGALGFDTCFDTGYEGITVSYQTELPESAPSGLVQAVSESDVCANGTPYFYQWETSYHCFSNEDGTSYMYYSYYCDYYGGVYKINYLDNEYCGDYGDVNYEFISNMACADFDSTDDDSDFLPDSDIAVQCFA